MNEEIKNLLDEEIKAEISGLSTLLPGSKEKSTAIENLETLYRLKIDETKTEIDLDEKRNRRGMDDESAERDIKLKQVQLEEDEKLIVSILNTNANVMEFGALKTKSELSGKKWDKAMKNLSALGLTEVGVEGDVKSCRLKG